jgi:F-type H+-transporting ATPase subunit gamma
MQTLDGLRKKISGAKELKSIVRTMKAMSASNIGQYEMAMESLGDYYATVTQGIIAYFIGNKMAGVAKQESQGNAQENNSVCAIVFGSDQGFVGQFNDTLTNYVTQCIEEIPGKKEFWTVGARIPLLLVDAGHEVTKKFPLPSSIHAITSLIGSILIQIEENHQQGRLKTFYIFHNNSKPASFYEPVHHLLLPLDEKWMHEFAPYKWPTKKIPEIIGKGKPYLEALLREYLFVILFKSCTESLASENYSRLAAMQRAEKNIDELLDGTGKAYHRFRQSAIDEELFDVVSGFEALKNNT